jgi:hypothetical protein
MSDASDPLSSSVRLMGTDLVAHGIECVSLVIGLLVDTLSRALAFNPVVARSLEVTVTHGPHLERISYVSSNG